MVEKKELEVGEEYLSIKLSSALLLAKCLKAVTDGEEYISIPAFKNVSDKERAPAYHSNGVYVWVNKKKEKVSEEVVS